MAWSYPGDRVNQAIRVGRRGIQVAARLVITGPIMLEAALAACRCERHHRISQNATLGVLKMTDDTTEAS
jgi:hypothetical protein